MGITPVDSSLHAEGIASVSSTRAAKTRCGQKPQFSGTI